MGCKLFHNVIYLWRGRSWPTHVMVYAFLGSPDQDIFLNILRALRLTLIASLSLAHLTNSPRSMAQTKFQSWAGRGSCRTGVWPPRRHWPWSQTSHPPWSWCIPHWGDQTCNASSILGDDMTHDTWPTWWSSHPPAPALTPTPPGLWSRRLDWK